MEFETFLSKNGIKHWTSAPYHPASNGLAERAVQIVKKGLKKITVGTVQERLAKLLLTYRITPQTTTGVSPAELLLNRRPRTRLDLLKPHIADRVEQNQMKQKVYHDNTSRARTFDIGDAVYVRNYSTGPKWLSGRVQRRTGPVSVLVKLSNGQIWRRHHDQLRSALNWDTPVDSNISTDSPLQEFGPSVTELSPPIVEDTPAIEASAASGTTASSEEKPSDSPKCYPKRIRRPVDRFEPPM